MSEKKSSNESFQYTPIEEISEKVERQRVFFRKEMSSQIDFRVRSLKKFLTCIEENESEISEAIYRDFRKSKFEVFATEIALVKSEIRLALKKISKWSSTGFEGYSLVNFPARMYSKSIPYGNTLIIGPWNYPFMLMISPLIGAIAAGNTAILKPSERTPNTSAIIRKIIEKSFDPGHVDVVLGEIEESQELLSHKFDFIFFTGSTEVGKIIYQKAAEHLCPVLLELGGKSPCIVNLDADIETAAKRIVWGKFLNGGQTCVAPDYILVHKKIKQNLLDKIGEYIHIFYGEAPSESPDYPRMVDLKHFKRIVEFLDESKIHFGGDTNEEDLYISPTVLETESPKAALMQEEIFGPLLPLLEFESIMDIKAQIDKNPNPLALYVFSDDEDFANKVIEENPSGDACINDVVSHFGEKRIGVGGIGKSGFGKYHGKTSFEAFSHKRSILKRAIWPDLPLRYPPYKGKFGLLKKLLNRI